MSIFKVNFVTTQVFPTSIYIQKVAFKIKSEDGYQKVNYLSFLKITRNLFLVRRNMTQFHLKNWTILEMLRFKMQIGGPYCELSKWFQGFKSWIYIP